MRAVLQRVNRARVTVDGIEVGAIGFGLLAYAGVASGDTEAEATWLARKIAELRLFPESTTEGARSMERSLTEAGGAVLLVSQFTLLTDTRKGHRLSFFAAASPEVAATLLDSLAAALQTQGIEVTTGRFGAHMVVESANNGPVTIVLDSGER